MSENNVSINIFQFPKDEDQHKIRTIELDGVIWFVARDVAMTLGYKNTNKAIKDHCKTKGVTKRYPLITISSKKSL